MTAEVLLAHAMHCERIYFHAHPEQELREVEWLHYGRYLHESLKGEPTQYITHKQEFYGREFRVTPDVLIPRPETEQLVETVLRRIHDAKTIIDVGTGSGAIAITLALEARRQVIATDISLAALTVAANNAYVGQDAILRRVGNPPGVGRDIGTEAPVCFVAADLLTPFPNEIADIIVSNPPYIAEEDRATLQTQVRDWEPALALFAGPEGLSIYERLIPEASRVLKPGGLLALEIGYGQSAAVSALTKGWRNLQIYPDLAGIPRVLVCEKP